MLAETAPAGVAGNGRPFAFAHSVLRNLLGAPARSRPSLLRESGLARARAPNKHTRSLPVFTWPSAL